MILQCQNSLSPKSELSEFWKCALQFRIFSLVVCMALQMNKRTVITSRTHTKLWCLQDGPFLWEKSVQGYILSSYFYGAFISHLPGGLLVERFGAKWTMAGFFSLSTVATFLTPVAARISFGVLILFRVLCGIGGVCFRFFRAAWHAIFVRISDEKGVCPSLCPSDTYAPCSAISLRQQASC